MSEVQLELQEDKLPTETDVGPAAAVDVVCCNCNNSGT